MSTQLINFKQKKEMKERTPRKHERKKELLENMKESYLNNHLK